MEAAKTRCPFIYASGRRCDGCVSRWKVYGLPRDGTLHCAAKVRLWCSKMDDHAGSDKSLVAKDRMEFYPSKLPEDLYALIQANP